jgi:hypothetical protein
MVPLGLRIALSYETKKHTLYAAYINTVCYGRLTDGMSAKYIANTRILIQVQINVCSEVGEAVWYSSLYCSKIVVKKSISTWSSIMN